MNETRIFDDSFQILRNSITCMHHVPNIRTYYTLVLLLLGRYPLSLDTHDGQILMNLIVIRETDDPKQNRKNIFITDRVSVFCISTVGNSHLKTTPRLPDILVEMLHNTSVQKLVQQTVGRYPHKLIQYTIQYINALRKKQVQNTLFCLHVYIIDNSSPLKKLKYDNGL